MKISKRVALSCLAQVFALSGCYVIPERDGSYSYYIPAHPPAQGGPDRKSVV